MDSEIKAKIEDMQKKIDKVYVSVEKTRKYFKWTLILTLAFFVLPLLALIVVIPKFISTYSSLMEGF